MDDGESSVLKNRKRTESSGGSDSELSEGWNIIDQTDVTNQDIQSSDGESVEVIDAEDESQENVTDTEVEGDNQMSPVVDTSVMTPPAPEAPDVPVAIPQEEMFDSSFCWFLFFATAAVVVSNLAFMVVENTIAWNMDLNVEAPSFLRDLPTTPKLVNVNNLMQNIPWAEKEDVTVESLDEQVSRKEIESKYDKMSQSYESERKPYKRWVEKFEKQGNEMYRNKPPDKYNMQKKESFSKYSTGNYKEQEREKITNGHNEKWYKQKIEESPKVSFSFDGHEIGNYFKALSDVTTSSETKNKLNQALLILDALYLGLNDLKEAITERSELDDTLLKQKHKLSQVLTELEYGVTKSLDRVATKILNKVQKLERRFENQWCSLEKRGYQEELKGLFYDCQSIDGKTDVDYKPNFKDSGKINDLIESTSRDDLKMDMNWNSYTYQVDKDSPGKEPSNTNSNEAKEMDDYYTLVKSKMKPSDNEDKNIYDIKNSLLNGNNRHVDDKRDNSNSRNDKRKFTEEQGVHHSDKGKRYDGQGKYYDNHEKRHNDKGKHHTNRGKQYDNDHGKHHNNNEEYYKGKEKYSSEGKDDGNWEHHNGKRKHYGNKGKHNDNDQHNGGKKKHINDKSYNEENIDDNKRKYDYRKKFSEDNKKEYKTEEQHHKKDKVNGGQTKSEKSSMPNPVPKLIKYLKESCVKSRNKLSDIYDKLISSIDEKLKVPKKMFDSLFAKYCQVNDDSFKWEKRFNREQPKGDFSGKNNKHFNKDELVIDDELDKHVRIVDVSEISREAKTSNQASENIMIPNNRPRQWLFSYEQSRSDNRSNMTGDWFFKSGESRSKIRWSHHRSDWWFERASHRRTHPRSPNWFSGRRKNWYFRRAWARQNCRHSPNEEWCDSSEDASVTVPSPSLNFR